MPQNCKLKICESAANKIQEIKIISPGFYDINAAAPTPNISASATNAK